ncbi:hypothetical protein KUCAC02_010742 [Chaenocephalus aceratus]|uniref:Uncharacterized protein n=1 Tax=Chaenocephalus aceratus TaxID=36190 RepID=A0ACB9WTT5_CHAAC|nr:hypothetical protein KUCAC02_010742 [Chaenocephalus aceratus]
MNIWSLLAFMLGCNAFSGLRHEVVEERSSGSLPCPHPVEGTVTWSRERNGNKVALFTIDGGREIRHNDPGKRYGSSVDKSLHIVTFSISDSGRYLCNDEAVELTVIPLGTIRVDATERSNITLDCPHDDGASHDPTWSRHSVEIHRQKGFDVPPVDRALTLTDVELRDSGLYYCGRKAVFLKVIEEGTKKPKRNKTTTAPTTTTTAAPTTATTAAPTTTTTAAPTTTTTAAAPTTTAAAAPTATTTTTTTAAPTTTTAQTTTTTATTTTTTTAAAPTTTTMVASTVASKYQPQIIGLVLGTVVLLLLLIITIVFFTWRRRFKRRGNEETQPVYDEIQDGFIIQTTNGIGSLKGPTPAYCMTDFTDVPNQNDPTYSTIPDLPPGVQGTDTLLPNESPYSLLEIVKVTQQTDGEYFLLKKPKAPENNNDQYV